MSDDFLLLDDDVPTNSDPMDFDVNTTAIKPSSSRAKPIPTDDGALPGTDGEDTESFEAQREEELTEGTLDDEASMIEYMLGGDGSYEE